MGGQAAILIGDQLRDEMHRQGLSVEELAARAGKQVDHVQAVLDGYPNSQKRLTQLDTVDQIAGVLGLTLELTKVV
jgi:transcriptional regulator with XRE-family HTH domain